MNPVEQVISARQAEFQSAFEAAKQSATTFETKLNERLNETTTAKQQVYKLSQMPNLRALEKHMKH